MKILSLFDGMSCGMLAMQAAGIKVDRYVAYEIDKYAVQTSSHNFPVIEHKGDVFQADFTEYSGFDFVLAGFPCTKFSIAQKNDRETEPYSGEGWLLFEQAWRAVCEAEPMYFLFENNKSMAKAVQQEISKIVGFDPILINSARVSAQNRQRLYWAGKRNPWGGYSKVRVDQPEDKGILLRDVLDAVPIREKANCLCGNRGGASLMHDLEKSKHNYAAEPIRIPEYGMEDKARPLNANYSNNCGGFEHRMFNENPKKQQVDMVAAPVRIGKFPNDAKNQAHDSQQYRIYSTDGKSVNLCGNGGGMGAKTGLYAIPVEFDGDIPVKAVSGSDGKTYDVYQVKDGFITIKGKQYPIKLADGFYIIRKLTVTECKRLQTVPEWFEFPVSDTQAYKMLGNGWTVEVIAHLIRATQADELDEEQLDLFKMIGV